MSSIETRGRRLVEILKQGQYEPIPVERQVVIIYAATNGFLDDVSVKEVRDFEADLNRYLDLHHKDILRDLSTKQALDDDLKSRLAKAFEGFKNEFGASRLAAAK